MKIETTIRINKNILRKLDHASALLKMQKTYLIRLLLKHYVEENRKLKIFLSIVKYQKRNKAEKWHTFHLTLREDEYELCLDLRKIYKMSLSFIVASSVHKYLNKVIKQFTKKENVDNTDNYLNKDYIFLWQEKNGIRNFNVFWGFPGVHVLEHSLGKNTV